MKQKEKQRIVEIGTLGSATEHPTLNCIVDHLNKMDNTNRVKVLKALNNVNQTVVSCNKIYDLKFRIFVKTRLEKELRENFKLMFQDSGFDISFMTHVDNFIHAKFTRREDHQQHIENQKQNILKLKKLSAINSLPLPEFHVFGSKSSHDYDIVVFVKQLQSINQNAILCKKYEYVLEHFYEQQHQPSKTFNVNLGVIEDGRIVNVHKGTADEVNNSVIATYHNHHQFHPLLLNPYNKYIRGHATNEYTHLKVKRCLRFLISFFSRIEHLRPFIKPALKGNVDLRLEALRKIDLRIHTDFSGKNEKVEDIYKVIAFQLAQTHLLIQGIEIYTKEQVIEHCPEFTNAILRQPLTEDDLYALQESLEALIVNTENLKQYMKSLDEPILNKGD